MAPQDGERRYELTVDDFAAIAHAPANQKVFFRRFPGVPKSRRDKRPTFRQLKQKENRAAGTC
jgi:hypothetical protein